MLLWCWLASRSSSRPAVVSCFLRLSGDHGHAPAGRARRLLGPLESDGMNNLMMRRGMSRTAPEHGGRPCSGLSAWRGGGGGDIMEVSPALRSRLPYGASWEEQSWWGGPWPSELVGGSLALRAGGGVPGPQRARGA
ncbi:unnamed protein product [Gadus morhua 'NCC']